jgi:hypothetical protein
MIRAVVDTNVVVFRPLKSGRTLGTYPYTGNFQEISMLHFRVALKGIPRSAGKAKVQAESTADPSAYAKSAKGLDFGRSPEDTSRRKRPRR